MSTETALLTATAGAAADGAFERAVGGPLTAADIEIFQVNITLTCNLQCSHCHVASSPLRRESMAWPTMLAVIRAAVASGARLVDITGGAPEIHPRYRDFVRRCREAGLAVQTRTNLTILLARAFRDMPAFFRENAVPLVASLPCYLEENVDGQRGSGVFRDSIEALKILNREGYGIEPGLELDLVYNPVGPHLPPPQDRLEERYRAELRERFGIEFTRLFTFTNMPIGRYLDDLARQGRAEAYTAMLERAYNAATVPNLMCRHQVSVGWDGTVYDCDFNLALGLPASGEFAPTIHDFDPARFLARRIVTGSHCFGCTAGAGSSCRGSLAGPAEG